MCGYAFVEAPAEPRTIFRVEKEAEQPPPTTMARSSALERVILDTLICFPDAYHAVVSAMRVADGLPPGTT